MQFHAPTPSDGFEPWELDTARAIVRSHLGGRRSVPDPGLEEDLVQECLLRWWLKRDQYDSARGANPRTFMNRVCENHLRSFARAERAKKRGAGRRALSLDLPVSDDSDSLSDLLADADALPDKLAENSDLLARFARVRERLQERERGVFDALADERPRTRIAGDLGIHRSTLYADIERIREIARDEGLEEFLG